MDTNKILSADLLDLVFDNRNKDYGAYELRKTYPVRITKALVFASVFVVIVFAGVVLANKMKPRVGTTYARRIVTIEAIPEDKKQEPIPERPRDPEPPRRTVQHVNYDIVPDPEVHEPPPTQVEIAVADVGTNNTDGDFDGTIKINELDEGKTVIEHPVPKEPEIFTKVEIDAKFIGNWAKFLERNLDAEVPINNSAPEGTYRVLIQFVVDIDGSVSDITPMTHHGYGLEEEAIRVIKKAGKWEPAIQNGRQVKAYRQQPITFRVESE
jgi:protein TonB